MSPAVRTARSRRLGGKMEYALEGYGYSVARVLRGTLAHRQREEGRDDDGLTDPYLRLLEEEVSSYGEELVRMLASRLLGSEQSGFEKPPELLSSLRSLGPSGPMSGVALRVASATKAAFDAFWHALKPRITICSVERAARGDEHMLLGVYAPQLTAEVRAYDEVTAGVLVALHGEPGGGGCRLKVVPRMYRKICQNGVIIPLGDGPSRELELNRLLSFEAEAPLAHALEQMLGDCFDVKLFESAVDSFRRSANDPIKDERLEDLLGDLSPAERQAVRERYRAEADFTRWGLLNALTAEARTAPSDTLLNLERLGSELARQSVAVAMPVPSRAALPPSQSVAMPMPSMSSVQASKKLTAA